MAASADDAVLAHLEFLERRMHDTDLRHATVLAALSDAQDALQRTQAIIATLSAEEMALRASRSELRSDIDSQRSNLERVRRDLQAARVQKILANFPRELLQHIFREAMCFGGECWPERDDDWFEDEYNLEQCVVPFTFAAVNGRWRDVALNTADIWNCVQVPCLDDLDGSPFLAYVRTLLRRSENRDLYVLLPWAESVWSKSVYYGRILNAIGKHVHRLRKFGMTGPSAAPESALQFLRLPMLRLEELALGHPNLDDGSYLVNYPNSSFTYLPICPVLRRLYNETFFSVPPQPYSELMSLYCIVGDISSSDISLLLAQCPSLQRLEMKFMEERNTVVNGQQNPIVLSNLRVLSIYGYHDRFVEWIPSMQMPLLDKLWLVDFDDVEGLVPVMEKVADTVTTLTLSGFTRENHLCAEDLPHIQKLRQLRHVVFDSCTYLCHDIPDIFSSRDSAGFPHLQSLTIENAEFDNEQATHVSRLMHQLHAMSSRLPERAITFMLKADPEDVPDWLIQQYEFISGSGGGGAAAGASDDASESGESVSPDPANESEEAEFTDGGSGSGYSSYEDWTEGDSQDNTADEAEN